MANYRYGQFSGRFFSEPKERPHARIRYTTDELEFEGSRLEIPS